MTPVTIVVTWISLGLEFIQFVAKFKSFREVIELSFMKVGLFFMLVMSPFAVIIYHAFFDSL
jgi:hypothetical protein